MPDTAQKNNIMHYVNIAITVALMFGFRFIPAPDPITPYGMAIVGIFLGVIWGWSTSTTGLVWVSFLAVAAVGLTDYGNVSKAIVGIFSSDTVLLLLLGMFLVAPIQKANLGEWMVAKCLGHPLIEGKPWRFTAFIIFGTGILGFLSNSFVVALFMLAILGDLFAQAGYQKGDKYPIMLIIGMFISLMTFSTIFPFKGWALYCVSAFKGAMGGMVFDFGKYIIVAVVFYIVCSFGYLLLMMLMRCDVSKMKNINLEMYKEKYQYGLNTYQKTSLGLVLAWVAASCLVSFVDATSAIGMILSKAGVVGVTLIVLVCFFVIKIDGKPIMKPDEVHVTWDMVFVVATGMFIASLVTNEATGVSAFLSGILGPFLASQSEFVFLLLLGIIGLILTNFLNNIAIMFIFMAVVGSMFAQGLLSNPYTAGMVVTLATIIGFYTPASSAYGAMIHGSDWCPSAKVYQLGLFVFVYLFIVLAILIFVANMVF